MCVCVLARNPLIAHVFYQPSLLRPHSCDRGIAVINYSVLSYSCNHGLAVRNIHTTERVLSYRTCSLLQNVFSLTAVMVVLQ